MSDWNSRKDREEGTWKFLQRLEQDENLRQECLADPAKARQIFEEAAEFTNMPSTVEVRAMEDNKGERDNLVIIAVPPAGELGERDRFDLDSAWICCWSLWAPSGED